MSNADVAVRRGQVFHRRRDATRRALADNYQFAAANRSSNSPTGSSSRRASTLAAMITANAWHHARTRAGSTWATFA